MRTDVAGTDTCRGNGVVKGWGVCRGRMQVGKHRDACRGNRSEARDSADKEARTRGQASTEMCFCRAGETTRGVHKERVGQDGFVQRHAQARAIYRGRDTCRRILGNERGQRWAHEKQGCSLDVCGCMYEPWERERVERGMYREMIETCAERQDTRRHVGCGTSAVATW